jgi:hypothetical protein
MIGAIACAALGVALLALWRTRMPTPPVFNISMAGAEGRAELWRLDARTGLTVAGRDPDPQQSPSLSPVRGSAE